jgi:uncharacterized protein YutE (UPF0331/DUF86 family)
MDLNKETMFRHLEELDYCIKLLKGHQRVSSDEFFSNQTIQDAVCRRFQIATECCIDLGNHVISAHGLKRPGTNTEIFKILFDYGYLENEEYIDQMTKMVRFRNLLTHVYVKINMEQVYSYLQNDIPLFESYQKMMLKLL